ncbi:MAG: efflux RND transporter periplasmic adaptor subunit [Endomicrobiia bacterium]|nr:efflux RND transporter periplasmic adaptor subunit [Endomicrobiia bacterium]
MNPKISRRTPSSLRASTMAVMTAAFISTIARMPADAEHCHPTHTSSVKSQKNTDTTGDTIYSNEKSRAESVWTCSMHPEVRRSGPGKCPICGMALIKVDAAPSGGITVPEETAKAAGIRTQKAARRVLVSKIRLPARISHDDELYTTQVEYLSAVKTSPPDASQEERGTPLARNVRAAELKLRLLGYDASDLKSLASQGAPDESLIYPGEKIWVIADVFESDLASVKGGLKVRVTPHGDTTVFDGFVKFVESNVNRNTRTAKARIEARAPSGKQAPPHETYADAEIEVRSGNLLAIPLISVIDTGKRKLVYVRQSPTSYIAREIVAGEALGDYIQVKSGLREGDEVVVEGNFMLDSQSTLGGGHSLKWGAAQEMGDKEKSPTTKPVKKEKSQDVAPVHRH